MSNEIQTSNPKELQEQAQEAGSYASDIRIQISTAREYPRPDINAIMDKMSAIVNHDPATATAMFYVLPRKSKGKSKDVIGGSIRLAELIAANYGNIRYSGKCDAILDTPTTVTAEGYCHDLENNVSTVMRTSRSIMGQYGRYNDSMITQTRNAAISIAIRNAIFKVVGQLYVNRLVEQSMKTAEGSSVPTEVRVKKMMTFLAESYSVNEDQVLRLLQRDSIQSITPADIVRIQGISNSINSGRTSVKDVFEPDLKPAAQKPTDDAVDAEYEETEQQTDDEQKTTALVSEFTALMLELGLSTKLKALVCKTFFGTGKLAEIKKRDDLERCIHYTKKLFSIVPEEMRELALKDGRDTVVDAINAAQTSIDDAVAQDELGL